MRKISRRACVLIYPDRRTDAVVVNFENVRHQGASPPLVSLGQVAM